jgi:hypothetical protein
MNNESMNKTNIKRQEMAQRPLLFVSYDDYENLIKLNLTNKGIGPAIIIDYKLINSKTNEVYSGVYQALNKIEGDNIYTNYTGNQNKLVLSPGEVRNLFKLDQKKYSGKKSYIELRKDVRKLFKDLEFEIRYKDVYESEMPIHRKSLEWFGRHFK